MIKIPTYIPPHKFPTNLFFVVLAKSKIYLKKIIKKITFTFFPRKLPNYLDRNTGVNIGEWPSRAGLALEMVKEHFDMELVVADFGCGKQTLRTLIPQTWKYIPIDYLPRTPDTILCNFNDDEFPENEFDIIFCLGVLEYLDNPLKFLLKLNLKCKFLIFSYNGFENSNLADRQIQCWKNNLYFKDIEQSMSSAEIKIIKFKNIDKVQRIYYCKGAL